MNIGIVTTWFERGAAYVSRQFEHVLEKDGHHVFIFARGGEEYAKGDPVWDKSNVMWATKCDYFILMSFLKSEFISWIKRNNIELVIFNEQRYYQPVLWCKELGVKTVSYIDYYTESTIPLFEAFDGLICNTKRHMSAFEYTGKAYYIPWGTDIDLYKPKSFELVNKDVVTFFHSAGMRPTRKGTGIFIEALLRMKQPFKAVIHSQKPISEVYPQLSSEIRRLEKEGKLDVIEKTVTAPGLYYMGDVYVYPSVLEGIGLTIAEAISSGLACLTSDNPPMNEFIEPSFGTAIPVDRLYAREDGYYWPQCHCNVDSLAEIMDSYASSPTMVVKKKKQARLYAEDKLSFEKNAAIMSSILKHISLSYASDDLRKRLLKYDTAGRKRFHEFYVKLGLYKVLKRKSY